jgi:tRNA-splicing ligase RtcB
VEEKKEIIISNLAKQHSCVTANLIDKRITLMGSDMDEAPMAYKDIHAVMAAQENLVEVLAKFEPRIVRMADPRERPED